MPPFTHRTLGELPTNGQENVTTGKWQEEGFAGGLPARNARELPYRACLVLAHGVSRIVAVDNLWIIRGFIHMPRKRA